MKKIIFLVAGILMFAPLAHGQSQLGDKEKLKNALNGKRIMKDGDDIVSEIPFFYTRNIRKNNKSVLMICMGEFGPNGTVRDNEKDKYCKEGEFVRTKDSIDRYKMKAPFAHSHDVPLMAFATGVCSDYHGVGTPSCHTEIDGPISRLWCRVAGDDTKMHAENYYGPAGIIHTGNEPQQSIPTGHACEKKP